MMEKKPRYQNGSAQGRRTGYQSQYEPINEPAPQQRRGAATYKRTTATNTGGRQPAQSQMTRGNEYQRQPRHMNMMPQQQRMNTAVQPPQRSRYNQQPSYAAQGNMNTQQQRNIPVDEQPVQPLNPKGVKKTVKPAKMQKTKKKLSKTDKKIKAHTKGLKMKKTKVPVETGKAIKRTLKIANKKLATAGAVVVLALGGAGAAFITRDQSKTMVCESSVDYNKGIGYTFYVGHNGRDIDTIEKNDTVSLKFIKKNLGEENAKQILEEYKKKTEESYKNTVEKYSKYSFFDSDIKITKDKVAVNYRIRVADESFSYTKYKDVLDEFGMSYFYNAQKDAFIYDETEFLSEDIPLGSIEDVACRPSTKKIQVKKASDKKTKKSSSKKEKAGDE